MRSFLCLFLLIPVLRAQHIAKPTNQEMPGFDYVVDINDELNFINNFSAEAKKMIQWRLKNLGLNPRDKVAESLAFKTVMRELLNLYNGKAMNAKEDDTTEADVPRLPYYSRMMETLDKYAKAIQYTKWTGVDSNRLDFIDALSSRLLSEANTIPNTDKLNHIAGETDEEYKARVRAVQFAEKYAGHSKSILFLAKEDTVEGKKVLAEVRVYNEAHGIKSRQQLRMGSFYIECVKSGIDSIYTYELKKSDQSPDKSTESITNILALEGQPLD